METKPPEKAKRRRLESQMVIDYLWEKHRESPQWRRVRVGPLPTHAMAKAFMVTLRWADAIFIEDGIAYIVEAKIKPDAGAVGQLLLYKKEFVNTPEFSAFKDYPVKLILLVPIVSLDLVELATEHEIDYQVWSLDPLERKELDEKLALVKERLAVV